MTGNEYAKLALAKEADQEKILQRVISHGVQGIRLQNAFTGLANEVGELSDILKGWNEYGRPLDTLGILEEAGDCYWRLAQLLAAIGFTPEGAMEANLRKLNIRFDGAATDHTEADRNREAERAALTTGEFTTDEKVNRCPRCAWPYAKSGKMEDGCIPGNCSQRSK